MSDFKVWECIYQTGSENRRFFVKDWILATSRPTEKSIGHYWKTLHGYTVWLYVSCEQIVPTDACDNAKIRDTLEEILRA